ncbi:MAG: DUF342 domain-containing protein [bacterium]
MAEERSIQISANSIEEGIERGSLLLHLDKSEVGYEVLSEEKVGQAGGTKTRYKLRLFPKPQKDVPLDDIDALLNSISGLSEAITISENMDGYSQVSVTQDGIMLVVYPPTGSGAPAELSDVMQQIANMGIEDVDIVAIKAAVRDSTGTPVKIGGLKPGMATSAKVEVKISPDKMRAYITILPPPLGGEMVTFEECLKALGEKGIAVGIKEDRIKDAILTYDVNREILVAEGICPVDGEDAQIEYKFKRERKGIVFKETEDGRIDYRDLDLIDNVTAGQVIATKVRPTAGTPGRNVLGEEVPAKPGRDVVIPAGKNTELSDDGSTLVSKIDGHVCWRNNRVVVEPIYTVQDVDLTTGNIKFLGNVIVRGQVLDNFSVKAAGDIIVHDSVGKSTLEAGGNIIVGKGIFGKGEGLVKAEGSIYARFVESARLDAGENVEIREAIMHSEVRAGNSVIVLGPKGLIVGGTVAAGREVNARVIGSEVATKTNVEVGVNHRIVESIAELNRQKKANKEDLEKIKKSLIVLRSVRDRYGSLPPEKEITYKKLEVAERKIIQKMANIRDQVVALESQLALSKEGRVGVLDRAYPGVKITIRNSILYVKDPFQYSTFYNDGGEIKILPYEEPKSYQR